MHRICSSASPSPSPPVTHPLASLLGVGTQPSPPLCPNYSTDDLLVARTATHGSTPSPAGRSPLPSSACLKAGGTPRGWGGVPAPPPAALLKPPGFLLPRNHLKRGKGPMGGGRVNKQLFSDQKLCWLPEAGHPSRGSARRVPDHGKTAVGEWISTAVRR